MPVAAMSTEAPYIGSKISLISKAEIRYEGVLYAVDTKEATVTLAKGESFKPRSSAPEFHRELSFPFQAAVFPTVEQSLRFQPP